METLAHHLLIAGAWAKAVPYLVQAGDAARNMCAYSDALRAYEQALGAMAHTTGIQPVSTIWSVQLKRGEICMLLGDYQAAIDAYNQVLQITAADTTTLDATARQGVRRHSQIRALNGLCYVYGLQNDYANASTASHRALELARASPAPADIADVYYQAGLIYYRQDEYSEAETYLQQALALYESVSSPETQARQARCLDALVACWSRREGMSDRVLAGQQQSLTICQALGDQEGERESLLSLSTLYLLRGVLALSLAASEAVLPFFRTTSAREKIAQCQYLRGAALYLRGHLDEGLAALDEALALCRELGREAAAQFVQLYMGRALRSLGDYDKARPLLEQACASDDRLIRARALGVLAELWLEQGAVQRAFELATEGVLLTHHVGAKPLLGRALRVLGEVRAADPDGALPPPSSKLPGAETCFQTSAALLEAARYDGDLGETLARYGAWPLGQKRAHEAYLALQRAHDLFTTCGMDRALEQVQRVLQPLQNQETLPPGVILVSLARLNAPRGRPLSPDEIVNVYWTLEAAEDALALQQGGKTAQRRARLRRLCAEAAAQGAEPTVADLAQALGVTTRTVSRDLAALRAAGETLPTRGSSDPADIGNSV